MAAILSRSQCVNHTFASNSRYYTSGYIMDRTLPAALYTSESGDTDPNENSTLHLLSFVK